ncbi:hypothetical protein HYX19_04250, partial [Candidatus Woesearchaeota archaeon]|nr:hypothetical protein [Candidatus Woesearchaeota archaeon]
KRIIFWSEFPEKVNWNKIAKYLGITKEKIEVYIAVRSKKEFLKWKKRINSRHIRLGAWPVLDKEKGYWFSGFTEREEIDKLDQFKGINFKLDIEPPLPRFKYSFLRILFCYFMPYFFKKAENSKYLEDKFKKLSKKSEIILSGFAFPRFITKRFGDLKAEDGNFKNYICYTTVGSRFLMKPYYKWFIRKNISKNTMFAIGCINKGIFGNEPIYKNLSEFKEDVQMLRCLGVRNIVIYSIEGLTGKQDTEEWLRVLFS